MCFSAREILSRVTFGESSSLKLISKRVLRGSGILKIRISEAGEELYGECFSGCKSLSRVTFGESCLYILRNEERQLAIHTLFGYFNSGKAVCQLLQRHLRHFSLHDWSKRFGNKTMPTTKSYVMECVICEKRNCVKAPKFTCRRLCMS